MKKAILVFVVVFFSSVEADNREFIEYGCLNVENHVGTDSPRVG